MSTFEVFSVEEGTSPVILAFPHSGIMVPEDVAARLDANGRLLADTDWHVDRLYAGLLPGATTVRAHFHRYVIDANRDPEGTSLYPGQNTTDLIPRHDFDNIGIWKPGQEPRISESDHRLSAFHTPYHAAIRAQITRVIGLHGVAVLYDCHSIRSRIPYLFEGLLPDLNVGTNDGKSCAPEIADAAMQTIGAQEEFSHILNGRFKGGWTTRHHANPAAGVHAIQMELAQATHLATESPPFAYDPARAERLRPQLARILGAIEGAALSLAARNEVAQ
ncbi:N-formylglutamate deformylase [Pelagibacterium montanilacus]|uniref:N-formylglutamate deformylase n=1 Tax=Pelagibacterium montanilacus TaxID=2185280 RepID=UPI000F8E79C1|nr:N-formylglutamate deformylase [Pelagibacterium montanilacus]